MARDSYLLNVNRLAIKSRWLYGLGGSDEITQLESRLQNCVVLENDRVESRLAAGELECWGTPVSPLLAANFSQPALLIPAGSGVIVTIESLLLAVPSPGVPWSIRRFYGNVGVNSANSPIARDTRAGSSRVPACQLMSVQGAALTGTLAHQLPAAVPVYPGPEIVMAASDTGAVMILVDTGVLAQAVQASFCWRERPFESGFLS